MIDDSTIAGSDVPTLRPTVFHRAFLPVAPALRVAPGSLVRIVTVDAQGGDDNGCQVTEPGNPLSGPIEVLGAEPGDGLVVDILRLTPTGGRGFSAGRLPVRVLEIGASTLWSRLDWLVDATAGTARPESPLPHLPYMQLPLAPMLGCIGVAGTTTAARGSLGSGPHGGNLDYPGIRVGTTLVFPVTVPGGLLFVGDGHACQGDGEVAGTGIEVPLEAELRVSLAPGAAPNWPRGFDARGPFALGSGPTVETAMSHAMDELARWLREELCADDTELAVLFGQSLRIDVANVYNPDYVVACRLPFSLLPPTLTARFTSRR